LVAEAAVVVEAEAVVAVVVEAAPLPNSSPAFPVAEASAPPLPVPVRVPPPAPSPSGTPQKDSTFQREYLSPLSATIPSPVSATKSKTADHPPTTAHQSASASAKTAHTFHFYPAPHSSIDQKTPLHSSQLEN
jgi:hypothetical protein